MKHKRYDGGDLRRVLAGMVTDQTVCSRIASQWRDGGLFDAPWANLIGNWCIGYQKEYGHPPNGNIRGLFESWAGKATSQEATIKSVERFLQDVSDEHENQEKPPTSEYLLDCAGRLFNKIKMKSVMELATEELDRNQVDEAYGKLTSLTRVELGVGSMVKPGEEYDVWVKAFDAERQKPLITYPGRLDRFLGSSMTRESLIAFMGPDKSGKSFWLLDVAFRGIRNRQRVAYFEVGDMGRDAVLLRLGQRAARQPLRPGVCRLPLSIDEEGKPVVKKVRFTEELTAGDAFKAYQKVSRGKDLLRLACYPNSSVNVSGLTSDLRGWEREGWTPDIAVIDYADILAPPAGTREKLDQIDETWRFLRRMSQELHCLVVTATQSSALAYAGRQRVLTRQHFSGRKTKLAHVNGMIGLNVSPEDKKLGVTRLNWVVKREGRYNEQYAEPVAGCLAIASPAIRTRE